MTQMLPGVLAQSRHEPLDCIQPPLSRQNMGYMGNFLENAQSHILSA